MAYKSYGRFGFGMSIHQNGEATLKLLDSKGPPFVMAATELTEHQTVVLLADLSKFIADYLAEIVVEGALNNRIAQAS